MLKAMICAALFSGVLVSCTRLTAEDQVQLDAYQRVYQAKGAALAMTLQDMVDLGLARRVNLADPASPAK